MAWGSNFFIVDGAFYNSKRVKLEIPVKGGWELNAVDAVQVGDLAVHKALGWNNEYSWQVTHVPTLTMFDRAIPEGNWTQEQLIKWCWKVQQSRYDLWEDFRRYTNKNYPDVSERSKELMKEYCLSISPGD